MHEGYEEREGTLRGKLTKGLKEGPRGAY